MTVIPLQLKPGDAAQKAGVQEQVLLMIGICTEIRRRFCPFRSAQGARGQTAGHLQKILNIARAFKIPIIVSADALVNLLESDRDRVLRRILKPRAEPQIM